MSSLIAIHLSINPEVVMKYHGERSNKKTTLLNPPNQTLYQITSKFYLDIDGFGNIINSINFPLNFVFQFSHTNHAQNQLTHVR